MVVHKWPIKELLNLQNMALRDVSSVKFAGKR